MKRIKYSYHRLVSVIVLQLILFLGSIIDPSIVFEPYIIGFYAIICAIAIIAIGMMGNGIAQIEEQVDIVNKHELLKSAIHAYFAVYNKKTRGEFEKLGISKIIAVGKRGKGFAYQWKFFDSDTMYSNFMKERVDNSFDTTIVVFDPNQALKNPGFISLN